MRMFPSFLRPALTLALTLGFGFAGAQAQSNREADSYSDSTSSTTRARTTRSAAETDPTRIVRAARTIYIQPNEYLDSKYLEYKLGKYPDFQQWKLAIVKDREKADLVLDVHRTRLNYIFSIVEPASSVVVVNGKVVAINEGVAAEEMSKEIIKRMKAARALPTSEPE